MAEEDTTEQQDTGGQPAEGSQLRQQLEAKVEENRALKQQLRGHAFREAGLDPEKGVGKLVAQTYEGPADADAIQQWMADNEIATATGDEGQQPTPPGQQAASRQPTDEEQQVRQSLNSVTAMRRGSQPVEGNRISYDDWKQKSQVDPKGAQQLYERGLVDIPPHIREHLPAG